MNSQEEEIIEYIARFIVDEHLEAFMVPVLEFSRPFGWIGGQLGRFMIGPWLYLFGGSRFIKYFSFLEKKENFEKVVERIEELLKTQKEKGKKEVKR